MWTLCLECFAGSCFLVFSGLQKLCLCTKNVVVPNHVPKKWYTFLYTSRTAQYVPIILVHDGWCTIIFGTYPARTNFNHIFKISPVYNLTYHFFGTYCNMYQILEINMVHHTICIIFSVHQYPCTKNNRVPKCFGTYPSFFWYNTSLYQKNGTYWQLLWYIFWIFGTPRFAVHLLYPRFGTPEESE